MTLDGFDETNDERLKEDHLATGVPNLDNETLGGLPAGSTIAILADPRGMADLFMYHLAHTERSTNYITTNRPARHIEETLSEMGKLPDNLTIEDVHATSSNAEDLFRKHAARLDEGDNLIVDSFTNYNSNNDETYIQTLRNLYTDVSDAGALAYLYFAAEDLNALTSAQREALHMCDGILRVSIERNGDNIDNRLEVLKLRGRDTPDDIVKLNLGARLTIDTTRDIA